MKITKVSYRENRASAENRFLHRHIELEAELSGKDTPESVLEQLKVQVRHLLYPELDGLQAKLEAISPLVGKATKNLTASQLSQLFLDHSDVFEDFLAGNFSPRQFIDDVLLGEK